MTKKLDEIQREGDRLMAAFRSNPRSLTAQDYNDLLGLFFRGFAIDNLREILTTANDDAIRGGVFLAEELGPKAVSVLPEVLRHLQHEDSKTRYMAYQAATSCMRIERSGEFIHVVLGLRDSDLKCRIIVMYLMARVNDSTLMSALRSLARSNLDPEIQKGLSIISDKRLCTPTTIRNLITGSDPLSRKFGLIAAVRAAAQHPELLEVAVASQDDDIRSTAQMELELKSGLERIRHSARLRRMKFEQATGANKEEGIKYGRPE